MLTNNEVELFRRAVDKAVENGWTPNNYDEVTWVFDPLPQTRFKTGADFIFTHDFAKAVWPDDKDGNVYWRMHLQRMVVSGNPIKYLGENYNDEPR